MKSFTRLILILSAIGAFSIAFSQQSDPKKNFGSYYPSGGTNLFGRRTAHLRGDILTIVINESSAASLGATTNSTKTDSNVVNPLVSPIMDWLKVPILNSLLGGGSNGATSSTAGTGTTTNNQAFTAMIAVVIKDVTPEGNFLIEGTKWLKVNKESQNLMLTGIVRPDDVQTNNQVLSQNVANAKITTDGKGLIADRQRRGLITRIMEWMF
jgi:flagellar L-ring protein precursor FlgH